MTSATLVSTPDDFKRMLQLSSSSPSLLLCLSTPEGAPVTSAAAAAEAECPLVVANAGEHSLPLFVWHAAGSGLSDARRSLDITDLPSLFVLRNGQFLDKLHGPTLLRDNESIRSFCHRIKRSGDGSKVASMHSGEENGSAGGSSRGALEVNVAKMLQMGKDLMAKSSPLYAEKFFLKALGVLDAAASEMDAAGSGVGVERDDVQASIALCLAWVVMSQLVQGRSNAGSNEYLIRLRSDKYLKWTSVPLSEEMRSVATGALFLYSPLQWTSDTCSQKKLAPKLSADPTDDRTRSLLVMTLFLEGDVERCITEALKLHVRGVEFGTIALNETCRFLGPEHPLVVRTGWKITDR